MRQKIKRVCFYGFWLMRFSVAMVFFLIVSFPLRFCKKYKNLWIISERWEEARDNGFWLYKWIVENRPEINVRYVLDKKSVDFSKMPRKELIIEPHSAKHYIYYILSTFSISTHMHGACPGKSFVIPFLPLTRHKKTIFLQHGIVKNKLKLRGGLDAIVASSEKEKNLITSSNRRYNNKVFVVGLCRYDKLTDLSNSNQRMILFMPTFRKWLRDVGRLKDSDTVFKDTLYFKRWNSLLNNDELKKVLEQKNIRIVFFPHNEMQRMAKNFVVDSHNIKVGKPGEYDVQTLLKSASLLVTDYSSVLFDFAYMNKPIVYYQFDSEEFFTKHYKSSGEPYPFGESFDDESSLVKKILEIIDAGFIMEKEYKDKANAFYKYRDNCNCERNFNLIKGLK